MLVGGYLRQFRRHTEVQNEMKSRNRFMFAARVVDEGWPQAGGDGGRRRRPAPAGRAAEGLVEVVDAGEVLLPVLLGFPDVDQVEDDAASPPWR
ncbi:MAG: hypothetical protein U1F87_15520 [Kiritimatiellia bacterium]